jgi:hypothetical protein
VTLKIYVILVLERGSLPRPPRETAMGSLQLRGIVSASLEIWIIVYVHPGFSSTSWIADSFNVNT